mmetsp:Transcript_3863/g.9704  ORF Transcript_3863/g.9704 Transcript_3863/m.9704 type:complete len:272 (+) Transcript_3863:110-925(+)
MALIDDLVDALHRDDHSRRFSATQQLGEYLSIDGKVLTQRLVKAGVVPVLIKLCKIRDRPDLQQEAAKALSYIAAEQPTAVVRAGALSVLTELLSSSSGVVREHALVAMGFIIQSQPESRRRILDTALTPLLDILRDACTTDSERPSTTVLAAARVLSTAKKLALTAIKNVIVLPSPADKGTPRHTTQVRQAVQCGCVEPLCALMVVNDDLDISSLAEEAVDTILAVYHEECCRAIIQKGYSDGYQWPLCWPLIVRLQVDACLVDRHDDIR